MYHLHTGLICQVDSNQHFPFGALFSRMKAALVLILAVALSRAELADLECPEDCDCYYFRINWVTDCSSSNLSSVPSYEDGLSSNVYILNMNENNLTRLDTFPEDIKLRSLQVAGNNLTELRKEYFQGLLYLLDADFSSNQISKVDPESFWWVQQHRFPLGLCLT